MTRQDHSLRRVLVTGAAGKTGQAVIGALLARGEGRASVRAFVRSVRHRKAVEMLGVDEVVEGDLEDLTAVRTAVRGIDAIYHICPNMHANEVDIGRTMIDAARAAPVERFVFHSVLLPAVEAMPHHWAKHGVEELLRRSGVAFTILQPAPYMQNLLGQWQNLRDAGVYAVPYDLTTRLVMVDLADVARVAARVLNESSHVAATYELCGSELLDQREIASAVGRSLDRPVRAEVVARRIWAEQARGSGLGAYQVETLLAMFEYYERHGMTGSSRPLAQLLGRKPTSFDRFLAQLP